MNFKSIQNYILIIVFLFVIQTWFLPVCFAEADRQKPSTVVIVPIDGRNQTYDYVERIVKICGYEPIMPPRRIMGNISSPIDAYKKQWNIWYWLNHALNDDVELLILSSDALVYGGLFESRHSSINLQRAYNNLKLLEIIREKYPRLKIHVFSSIPRKDAQFRDRNQLINRRLLQYVEDEIIDFLSISGDDVTDIGNQVLDIAQLKSDASRLHIDHKLIISDVDRIRLGVDESAMVLFIRHLNSKREKPFKVFIEFREITSARITNDQYSATPVMSVALDMIGAAGAEAVFTIDEADLVLAANHHSAKISMDDYLDRIEAILDIKPVTIGDFSNREQQSVFFEKLYKRGLFERLAGYANWGMGTNTTGTAICQGIASLLCHGGNSCQEKGAFLYERLITDYIYLNKIHLHT